MIKAVITIDTEADHSGHAWVKSNPLRFHSVVHGIPRRLTPLFQSAGARPTYLLTTEVMRDPQSVEVLRCTPNAELGTHLHGDHVEPRARVLETAGAQSWDFNSCYEEAIELAKLESITQQFRDCFGHAPTSYRAGRYAASGRSVRILSELGYVVDTSVTPGIRWVNEADPACLVDFHSAPIAPYHPSEVDLAHPGQLPIWEVPITIVPGPRWLGAAVGLYQRARRRPVTPNVVWLRPSTTSWPWLHWIVRNQLRTATTAHPAVFNVAFHSMEVVAGASPYAPDEHSADRVLHRLQRLLQLFSSLDARFLTLTELAASQREPT